MTNRFEQECARRGITVAPIWRIERDTRWMRNVICYLVGHSTVIVTIDPSGDFEVYTPANRLAIGDAFADMLARIGAAEAA